MLRVFHAGPWPEIGGEITLGGEESSHLVRVRRARVGEVITVLNGRGDVAECLLTAEVQRAARTRLEMVVHHPKPPMRQLAVGLPKGDIFGEIIRQAAELGATEIQPLLTDRVEVHLDKERAAKKLDRWRASALEACKQSGNPWLPEIHAPADLGKWLKNEQKHSPGTLRLVAALTPDAVPLAKLHTSHSTLHTSICIGPEGDFSPDEYAAFKAAGFQFVRLPGHVLRVETACVVALANLQIGQKGTD